MWFLILIMACVAAYLAGRSRFWHVVFARLLLVGYALWVVVIATVMSRSGIDLGVMFLPPIAVCAGALALRWVFSPAIPQIPIISMGIARIAAQELWRHIMRNIHHFAGRPNW